MKETKSAWRTDPEALQAFSAYAAAYDPADPKIRLKIDHTYRVADLCRTIARARGWRSADVHLAWLCGLLHDIGRFEQVRRWGTFNDSRSISHAALGAQILFGGSGTPGDTDAAGAPPRSGIIRRFAPDPSHDTLIKAAVALHSNYRLPDDLDERTRGLCQVVRDADKIDILRVNCIESAQAIYGVSEQQMRESPISEQALSGFAAHRTLRRTERTYPADFVIGHLCFAFELAYPESLVILRRQGYLNRLLRRPFNNAQTAAVFADLRRQMNAWLDSAAPH